MQAHFAIFGLFTESMEIWIPMQRAVAALTLLAAMLVPSADASATQIYFNDFDGGVTVAGGVSASLIGAGSSEGVQGFAGLGTGGNVFSGSFLRNAAAGNPATASEIILTNLPVHTSVNLGFLLAIIDSWDGTGDPNGPDSLNITVDGSPVFSEIFNHTGGTASFSPDPGVLLSTGTNLGFSSGIFFTDSAYDMALQASLSNLPHTSSTLAVKWFASGPIWQAGSDESWAMDNLTISIAEVPEPGTATLLVLGLATVAFACRTGYRG